MASPFRDDPYRRPDFGIDGGNPRILQAPARVGQHADPPTLPSPPGPWPMPRVPSPPPGPNPFPDPSPPPPLPQTPPPHNLDPSDFPGQAGGAPVGGLLGRLLALQDEQARNALDAYRNMAPARLR